MSAMITAEQLSKVYSGGNRAVNQISFELKEGEIFGFLGPNGAGKTTTVKLLCGMLTPTEGLCRVAGLDPIEDAERLHQITGVVTEHAQMYDYLTGLENLIFYGTLFGMNRTDGEKRAQLLMERLELSRAQQRRLSAYSTGMRQRLSLARAMMHSPRVLFLDEPTSGLDPENAQNVNALIQELAAQGTTIFLCTHQLRYAQEICTVFGLMDQGSLIAQGGLSALRAMISDTIRVVIRADHLPKGMEYEALGGGAYAIPVRREEEIPALVRQIVQAGGSIYHVSQEQMTLENIYFSLIERRHENGEGNAQ